MKLMIATLLILGAAGCASTPVPTKVDKIEECVVRLSEKTGAKLEETFEVCRQLHRLRKVD